MIARRRKPIVLPAMLAGLLLITAAQARQVMEQIPDDALIVVKVKNLSTTSTKIGKVMTDLAVTAIIPGTDNPLNMIQQKLNLKQGVKTDGDMAIVFRDPEKVGVARPDESIVMLIPVTDFAAFVSNFNGAKPEGDITTVKMPASEEEGFIAQWGSFAAMSPSKAVLEHKPSAMLKIPGAATNRELSSRDIVAYVNFVGLRPKAQETMKMAREHAMQAVEGIAQNDKSHEKLQPVIRALATQLLGAADAFVRDANAVTFSISLGDDGINAAVMAEFAPESYCGSTVASVKNTDQPLLAGLPTGKYLLFGGQVNQPGLSVRTVTDFGEPIVKELEAIGPEMKPGREYFEALIAYLKVNKSSTFGMLAPAGALGQESIIQIVSVAEGDAKVMKETQQKMFKSQQELMKALELPDAAATITPNAKTVDGVTFDSITSSMDANPNDPKARQQQMIMSQLYGPNGMSMLQADVGGRFLMTMGVNDEMLSKAIASAKSGAAPIADSDPVKRVAPHLPSKRVGEMYIAVDQIVMTVAGYAKAFGAPININLQPDLPPVGVSMSQDGSAMRCEAYIPTQLVQQLVAQGMQTYMQMQGGKDGGGGGGGQ